MAGRREAFIGRKHLVSFESFDVDANDPEPVAVVTFLVTQESVNDVLYFTRIY